MGEPQDKRFTVLVVDNDVAVLQKVEKILQKGEFEVNLATDGALAINRAIASPPNIVISAVEMPLLDGFKLCQLLRTNPITRDIPFIFLTSKNTSPQRLGKYLRPFDEFMLKPFREEELLGRMGGLQARMERAEDVAAGEQQALMGTLSEITLMDLLQILRMNRRSGFLDLEQEGRVGTVYIRDGEVVNAKLGKFKGEKAFFRLLDWSRGKFDFRPQSVETEILITRPGENLILEGLRQLDEVNKLKESLSGKGVRLELVKQFQGPPDKLKPVTRETLSLLNYFSSLEDLLDQSTFGDLEICQTLKNLVDKKIVAASSKTEPGRAEDYAPLLSLEDALKLSYQLGVGREEGTQAWSGKVLLFANHRPQLQQLLEGLSKLREFRIEAGIVLDPKAERIPLGRVGTIQVLEGTDLTIYCFPGQPSFHPLWEPLSQGALGALVLARAGDDLSATARFCGTVLKRPFLVCGPDLTEEQAGETLGIRDELTVPWATAALGDGSEDTCREAYRRLFGLILQV